MKKIVEKINFLVGAILLIGFLCILIYFSPVRTFINNYYASAKDCTVESAHARQSGGPSTVASRTESVAVSTTECGNLWILDNNLEGRDEERAAERLNELQGQKVQFLIGPLSWNFGTVEAVGIIYPDGVE